MSRLFITQREINFISDINKELFKDVVGQVIYYYAISELKTKIHDLYTESPEKIYDNPIAIEALVSSPEQNTVVNMFGPEKVATLEVYIHMKDMVDRGINICIGDFIRYGETMYEIAKANKIRQIYGHVEQVDGIKLECTQARQGQFDAPQIGPTEITFNDDNAVQKEFSQQRGSVLVDDKPTNDIRELRNNGTLDEPLSAPSKIVETNNGSKFYDDE